MAEVDFISLALRRQGVRQFPPSRHGAQFSDNPKTEVWNIQPDIAGEVYDRAYQTEVEPEDIIRLAIRNSFQLPDAVGQEPFSLERSPRQTWLVIDRDHILNDVLKAVAMAKGNTHLAMLESCLRQYLEMPPSGPQSAA